MNNRRNQYGVKDSINCYLTIKGVRYEQWCDCSDKEEAKEEIQKQIKEGTDSKFIVRKVDGYFYRVYYTKTIK